MDNKEDKKDLSADELIRQLNISLGLSPEGLPIEEKASNASEDDDPVLQEDSSIIPIADTENEDINIESIQAEELQSDDTTSFVAENENEENISDDASEKTQDNTEKKQSDTLSSLLGFSDTLDRMDDSVFQPAPIKKAASSRGVNSINLAEKEPEEERKVIFDDSEFEEEEEDFQPTSAFKALDSSAKAILEDDAPDSDISDTESAQSQAKESRESTETEEIQDEDATIIRTSPASENSDDNTEEDPSKSKIDLESQFAFDQIYSETEKSSDGYDDTEHDIMNAVNFKEVLDELYDDDKEPVVKKVKEKSKRKKEPQNANEPKRSKTHDEYVNAAQNKPFLEKYKKRYLSSRLRICGTVVFSLLLLCLESIIYFKADVPHFLDPVANPRVLLLVCFQLFLICSAFAVRSLISGLKGLVTGRFTSDVMTFVFVAVTFIFGVFACITAPQEPLLMFSPCTVCIFASLISEYRDLKREISAFKIVSSNRMKYTIEKYTPSEKSIEKNEFYNYLPENPELLKINKTNFIENFVSNFSKTSNQRSVFGIITLACLVVFAVVFAVMFSLKNSVYVSLTSAFTVLCAVLPASLYTAFSLPLYKTSTEAFSEDSTFIGEKVADDFSSVSVVSFDDKEVFPSYGIKVQGYRTYLDSRDDHVVFVVSSIFSKLGGPLKEVFAAAANEIGKTDNVKIYSIYEDGIEADVDEEHVLIGSAAFMEEKHYIPLYTADDEAAESNNSKRIMYVAFGGTIVAKFYIKYAADPDFSHILRQLTDAGMCIAVKTFDPNIDTALLASEINIKKYPVRVVKCENNNEMSSSSESVESTIISRGSAKSLLKTLTNCRKLSSVIKTGTLISSISIIIAIMIMVFAYVSGIPNIISSLAIVVYQLVWMVITHIITGAYIK